MAAPQFGEPEPDQPYKDRPCAFGVAHRWGRIAVVHVGRPGEDQHFDLPGGALDAGEAEAEALVREFAEETGLVVRAGALLGRADQYVVRKNGKRVNNRSALLVAEVVGREPSRKIEDDHRLLWLRPDAAIRRLRHDSHAWAVSCWMRADR